MEVESQPSKGRDGAISALNEAIEALNPAKISSIPPIARAIFGSVSILLTTIRVCLTASFTTIYSGLTPS